MLQTLPVDQAGSASRVPVSPARLALTGWVERMTEILDPTDVVWCDGSADERQRLLDEMVLSGALTPLNPKLRPNSYLARSHPSDVARVEAATVICTPRQEDAGPNNNWRESTEMRAELRELFEGAMRGRVLYVVPFAMGAAGDPLSRLGVQLTDSPYAVVSTGTMTRMGAEALARIEAGEPWVPAVHSVGMPLVADDGTSIDDVPWPCNDHKVIAHFPETREIFSYGSGYGGNAILAKKCFALRIASVMARDEGWLAEHMLLVRVTSPQGRRFHIAAAFPSACGKTNFAMMRPGLPGWRVETIGDDITWLRPGADGRLWAMNPEAGLFGVAPGTGEATNPVAMECIRRDTIVTNAALTDDGDVWWEGMTAEPPAVLQSWLGVPWNGQAEGPAAHPNARFTVAMERCPSLAEDWDAVGGVPVDAIVLGGRRSDTVPLVTEASDWAQGVFFGATMSSQRTAAAEGVVGEQRFDPFAMQPFCGYDMAEHWQHWLAIGERLGSRAPRVFRVNWFRRDAESGRFLWPGFGENIRVVDWIARRLAHEVPAVATPIGLLPYRHDLDLAGLDLADADVRALLTLDLDEWYRELPQLERHFAGYGERVPAALTARLAATRRGLWEYLRG